jgi:sec-independent protein translocase protein TatA
MPSIGPMELVIVLVIALLVLGPKRLPAAGRSLGEGLREFKESITGAKAPPILDDPPAPSPSDPSEAT